MAKEKDNPYLIQTLKRSLVDKIFNSEILNRKDFTIAELSRRMGTSTSQTYRMLRRFGFDTSNNYANPKSKDEIADLIWENLTGKEIEKLYIWGKEAKFDKKVEPEKRSYELSDEGRRNRIENRKRNTKDEQADRATNAALIKNAGIPVVDEPPVAKDAKEARGSGIEKTLHDFVTTDDSTESQVDNLLRVILLNDQPQTEAVGALVNQAQKADNFNQHQWAMKQLSNRVKRRSRDAFFDVIDGNRNIDASNEETRVLLKAYQNNAHSIDLGKIR